MPSDFGDGTLDGVGVLEDHDGLGSDGLRHELWVLTSEILLEQVDLVVLFDAARGTLDELLGGLHEAHCWVLGQLSHVLVHLVGFLVVILLGPATDAMGHTAVLCWDALSVNLLCEEKWTRLEDVTNFDKSLFGINLESKKSSTRFKNCNLRDAQTEMGCCQG